MIIGEPAGERGSFSDPMSVFSEHTLEIHSQKKVGTTAAKNTRPTFDESKLHTDCKWSGRAGSWQLNTTLDIMVRKCNRIEIDSRHYPYTKLMKSAARAR